MHELCVAVAGAALMTLLTPASGYTLPDQGGKLTRFVADTATAAAELHDGARSHL